MIKSTLPRSKRPSVKKTKKDKIPPSPESILIRGARQNNLKNFDLNLPLNKLIVVTGVSGSGKSSLAFDTVYAEGQRRYVETFSPYARQFLERMDKPQVDSIQGIPPSIAIDQTNPVRTSRSTVGTMTELNDHLKLIFARASKLYCRQCSREVRRDNPETIADFLYHNLEQQNNTDLPKYWLITFRIEVPANFSKEEVLQLLQKQGYSRLHHQGKGWVEIIQDRIKPDVSKRSRLIEDLEKALEHGRGKVSVYPWRENGAGKSPLRFSSLLHCAECDLEYRDVSPGDFSFNSPIGACETCRGFGRVIGVDYNLVIPDETLTLKQGAVKIWQSKSYSECQDDLIRFAKKRKIPLNTPWNKLSRKHKDWVIDGEGDWDDGLWYGISRFFKWLETKAYKMHIRVLLSRYRSYQECQDCHGARLKPDSLLWRLGLEQKMNLHEIMLLPIDQCYQYFKAIRLPRPMDEATKLVLDEILARLGYLNDVGLGYLTLDRQSRTLSGGEVQRINLTTALGTSLVNTLFVLDEPSIGLHSRDVKRLVQVLYRLRDAGNSLLVVEHDPELIQAADMVIDMGPGPGTAGGEIVFQGQFRQMLKSGKSLTADYFNGKKTVTPVIENQVQNFDKSITIHGAGEHNLRHITVHLPLNRMVCITGVSGSGKSTLIRDIVYNGIRKFLGKPVDPVGSHSSITGWEQIKDIVLVDQSPIGKTTRSNPASYVKAFDPIRKLFCNLPESKQKDYKPGTFSFNSASGGSCGGCGGSGFRHYEMQFLSDVYIRCPDCDGKRFRSEILEIQYRGKSISDVLDLTVAGAVDFFADQPAILRGLEPLREVGLEYLQLGQPVPTLSGGEAQRLKLAGHLAQSESGNLGDTLFLFDEPTTGLHFRDIEVLLKALRKLLQRGHSVMVIEHNLDVIASADWLVDLGPEGGNEGGELLFEGPRDEILNIETSYTAKALKQHLNRQGNLLTTVEDCKVAEPANRYSLDVIGIKNAREHNLKGIDLDIPRNAFTVISGISGSGKSTVAFDILFAEGQRRYLESLNAYARQFVQPSSRPELDAVFGIPPTVAIEQRVSRGGRKSTVATVTEIYHFLRLLFAKLGTQHCPDCNLEIQSQSPQTIQERLLKEYKGKTIQILVPMVRGRKGIYKDLAQWAHKKGYASLRVDGKMLPTSPWPKLDRFKEHDIELPLAEIQVTPSSQAQIATLVEEALNMGKGIFELLSRNGNRGVWKEPVAFSSSRNCPGCRKSFAEPDPRMFSFNSKHGWCSKCYGTGLQLQGFDEEQTGEEAWWNSWWEGPEKNCLLCNGTRLRPESLAIYFDNKNIAEVVSMPVEKSRKLFKAMKLSGEQAEVARDLLSEITERLKFLEEVGLPYLSLDRAAPTLSGGEAQRIRLAAQLGSNLRGVAYILDEPSIGLHPRDNALLLSTLRRLRDKGNSVIVVEHDEDTILQADHLVDLGQGAGAHGGNVTAFGTVKQVLENPESLTGQFLRNPLTHPLHPRREVKINNPAKARQEGFLKIHNANLHNLKKVNVNIPLQRFVCVTGVSGSGKSTLVREIILENLYAMTSRKFRKKSRNGFLGCEAIEGFESVERVLEVDQTPIGRTPRSCPATYVGIWDTIRKIFASVPEAKIRGYNPGRFSFNVHGGRCDQCEGQGMKTIEMSFLPNVTVPCEACRGKRFNPETLQVKYAGKDISQVLDMSVEDAVTFFSAFPKLSRQFKLLNDVGLGYLRLGQASPTLSGGEAQRVKLVTELAKQLPGFRSGNKSKNSSSAGTMYILDEPTIGLHMADVEKLIHVLHRLVDSGNSLMIIEHNLDIMAEADWIVDLGPEGGDHGGEIMAQGTPEEVAKVRQSRTGKFLKKYVKQRKKSGTKS